MNRESCVTKVGGIKPAHLHESTAGSGKSRVDDKGPWPPAAPASTPRHKKNRSRHNIVGTPPTVEENEDTTA